MAWAYRDVRPPSWMLRVGVRMGLIAASFAGAAVVLAAGSLGYAGWAVPAGFLIMVGATGALVYSSRGVTRARTVLERHGYGLCTGCGYDLRTVPSPGACPECGEEF